MEDNMVVWEFVKEHKYWFVAAALVVLGVLIAKPW